MNPANLDLANDNSSFEIDSQSSGKKLTAIDDLFRSLVNSKSIYC